MTEGYKALREGAAIVDLSGRGMIRASGEDRKRLLHAMTTNHVEQLQPGQGCYAFFLNAQGRILADVNLFCLPEELLLDTEPETRERVFQHLDKYIIADDVTLEDLTGPLTTLAVEGPKAAEILVAVGAPIPAEPYGIAAWDDRRVARVSTAGAEGFRFFLPAEGREALLERFAAAGAEGFRFFLPAEGREALLERFAAAGAVPADAADVHVVRLENGRPRYGEDLTEAYIPHETQLLRAVHFNKGCYLGQEIVERVRSRGHVHRLLVQLRLDAAAPPAPGTKLTSGGQEAGQITSAAFSPALGKVVALGYVRALYAREGVLLEADGATAEISTLRPN